MESNFKCTQCNFQFFIPKYTIKIIADQAPTYSTKFGVIQCSACQSTSVEPLPRQMDLVTVAYGRFSSASEEDKKRMLKKRAQAAMHKDAEQRHEIDTHFRGRVNESHY